MDKPIQGETKFDYLPLGGTDRHYRSVDGSRTISKRQFSNLPLMGPQELRAPHHEKSHTKYTHADLVRLANTPKNQLTSYQKQLVRDFTRPQTASDIAKTVGAPESQIKWKMNKAGMDVTSMRAERGGWIKGTTEKGTEKYMVKLNKGGGTTYQFYTKASYQRLIDGVTNGDEGYEDAATAMISNPMTGEIFWEGAVA